MLDIVRYILDALSVSALEFFNIVFSLVLAIGLSFLISQIYKFTHRGLSFELSFMSTLVLLAPIVTIVMLFIRGDLVLSLGLIGSLSIIRFRTPIKDTRDMVFLFWTIAVGLGSGTYNWSIVIIASIIITIVMFILHFIDYGQSINIDYVFVVSGSNLSDSDVLTRIIEKYTKHIKVRSKEVSSDYWEIVYEIQFAEKSSLSTNQLVEEVNRLVSVDRVSLLAPQMSLPV